MVSIFLYAYLSYFFEDYKDFSRSKILIAFSLFSLYKFPISFKFSMLNFYRALIVLVSSSDPSFLAFKCSGPYY